MANFFLFAFTAWQRAQNAAQLAAQRAAQLGAQYARL